MSEESRARENKRCHSTSAKYSYFVHFDALCKPRHVIKVQRGEALVGREKRGWYDLVNARNVYAVIVRFWEVLTKPARTRYHRRHANNNLRARLLKGV